MIKKNLDYYWYLTLLVKLRRVMSSKKTTISQMKHLDPLLFRSDNRNYCVRNISRNRHPIALSLDMSQRLDVYLTEKIMDPSISDQFRRELAINRICFDNGLFFRGVFYFRPLAWDFNVQPENIYIPSLDDSLKYNFNNIENFHLSNKAYFNNKNEHFEDNITRTLTDTTNTIPFHNYVIGFKEHNGKYYPYARRNRCNMEKARLWEIESEETLTLEKHEKVSL